MSFKKRGYVNVYLKEDIRMKPMFSPSLMCMDLLKIREQIQILNMRADFYHIDIMDGHFVKNITFCQSSSPRQQGTAGLSFNGYASG